MKENFNDKYFMQAIDSIVELVKIESVEEEPSSNMPFGRKVADALDYSLALSEKMGLKSVNLDGYVGYSDIGEGELFGILGHIDVVPIGSDWDYKQGEIAEGILYGRGVMDDKGPMLLCLYALKQLLDEGNTLKHKVRFIWGADEESGWKCIEYYKKKMEMPNIGFSPDADFPVIYAEKGIVHYDAAIKLKEGIIIKAKGGERVNMVPDRAMATVVNHKISYDNFNNLDFIIDNENNTITALAKGISAHGSTPHKADNAIWKIIDFLSSVDKSVEVFKKLTDYTGAKCCINAKDDICGELTINVGTMNIVNDSLTLELDIRYPLCCTKEGILERLKSELHGVTFTETMEHKSLYVDKNNAMIQAMLTAYNKVTGEKREPIAIGGGTYARALPLGVAFGPILPGKTSSIHEKNENASLDDLKTAYKIYYEALKTLVF